MKKILIAIDNDFIREAYSEVFKREGFEVSETKSGVEALDLAGKKKPDVILADIVFAGMEKFELLEKLKKELSTKDIPVVIFAQLERRENRRKAMELEAKDFITAAGVSPIGVVRKVRIILGEQKSYRIKILKESDGIKELVKDLNCDTDLQCPKCGSNLEMCLIRDLSAGKSHFIISFVCPECS